MGKKTTATLMGNITRSNAPMQVSVINKCSYLLFGVALLLIVLSACATANKEKQLKAHYNIGVAKLNENDIQGAYVEFKRALELNPRDKESLNALGIVYLQLDDYDHAKQSLLKALEVDPKYSEAYNNLGLIYVRINQWEESVNAFENAIRNPFYSAPDKAYNNLGYSLYRLGRYEKAISAFNESIKRNESNQLPYYGLALAHNAIGHYGDASVFLMDAIKYDPNYNGNVKKAQDDFNRKRHRGNKQDEKDYTDFLEILNY
ncbi:MAG: tetratricopeptide repeat protein [Nitrospirae bacterium]|nr:tetratricopeptide repeat protein [Nitrospirota bacterium]